MSQMNVIVDSYHVECHPVGNPASYMDIKNHVVISYSNSRESQPKVISESHNNIKSVYEDKLIELDVILHDES